MRTVSLEVEANAASLGKGPWPRTSLLVLLAVTLAAETAMDIGARLVGTKLVQPIDYETCADFCFGSSGYVEEVSRDSCKCYEPEVEE